MSKKFTFFYLGTLVCGVFFAFNEAKAFDWQRVPTDTKVAFSCQSNSGTYSVLAATSTARTYLNFKLLDATSGTTQIIVGTNSSHPVILGRTSPTQDLDTWYATSSQITLYKTGAGQSCVLIHYLDYDPNVVSPNISWDEVLLDNHGGLDIYRLEFLNVFFYLALVLIPIILIVALRRKRRI